MQKRLVLSHFEFEGFRTVMPARAGIQGEQAAACGYSAWIPAFAGMTQPSSTPQNHHDRLIGIGFVMLLVAFLFLGSPATKAWAHGMAGVGGFQGGGHSSGGRVQGSFGGFQGRAMQPGFQGSFAPSRTQGFSPFPRFQPGQVFAPRRPIVNRFRGRFPSGIFFGSPFFPDGSQIVVINAPSYEIPPEPQCGPDAYWDATTGQCRRNTAPSASPAQFFFPSGVIVLRPGGIQEQADSCPEEFVEQIQKGVRFCVDPEHPESVPLR